MTLLPDLSSGRRSISPVNLSLLVLTAEFQHRSSQYFITAHMVMPRNSPQTLPFAFLELSRKSLCLGLHNPRISQKITWRHYILTFVYFVSLRLYISIMCHLPMFIIRHFIYVYVPL